MDRDNYTKTKVDIEDINEHLRFKKIVNRVDLHDIEWYENGRRLYIDKDVLEDFYFTGLNNIDFISTNFYKTGFVDNYSRKSANET